MRVPQPPDQLRQLGGAVESFYSQMLFDPFEKEQIGFAANSEERLCLMQLEPASEIGETPINDIKAAGFGYQDVENIDPVHLAVADVDEGWNVAAQVDHCSVQCIRGLFQLLRKAVFRIKFAHHFDLNDREIG